LKRKLTVRLGKSRAEGGDGEDYFEEEKERNSSSKPQQKLPQKTLASEIAN
jgi:hypothetical protein